MASVIDSKGGGGGIAAGVAAEGEDSFETDEDRPVVKLFSSV